MRIIVLFRMERTITPTESLLAFFIFLPFLLLLVPGFGSAFDGLAFWFAMFICASLIWLTVLIKSTVKSYPPRGEKRMLSVSEYPTGVKQVMRVEEATEETGIRVFRGELTELSSVAHARLQEMFKDCTVILLPVRNGSGNTVEGKGATAAIMLVSKATNQLGRAQHAFAWLIVAFGLVGTLWVGMN